jgi:nucleoid-associated protein YgaU
MQKISLSTKHKFLVLCFAAGLVTSCAGSKVSNTAPDVPTSEASLLDASEKASTPVVDDSSAFADLHNGSSADGSDNLSATSVPADNASGEVAADAAPFYNPIGGESLGRVAYTLYGSRKLSGKLLQQNPGLKGVKALQADQRVYFDFSEAHPEPTFLTKDLLDRYPAQLAAKIEENSLSKQTVTLAPGETLQALSQRLYGTTRYWTEIYLLNRNSVPHYDKVKAGLSLVVYQRAPVATATTAAPTDNPPPPAAGAMEAESGSDLQTQPAQPPVMPAPSTPAAAIQNQNSPSVANQAETAPPPEQETSPAPAPTHVDPIPDTPPAVSQGVANSVPTPAPMAHVTPKGSVWPNWSSPNTRRAIYVVLIVLIGGLAFFLTRSNKKTQFDMLDVTTVDTAAAAPRPKFDPKDSQKQGHG